MAALKLLLPLNPISDTAQSAEPAKLRGKERKKALAEAEAAADAELLVLISDNSITWNM